jgi:hypothetical protein
MDKAFEGIMNVLFYFVLFCIVLAVMGMDPFVLFASISGFVLGFAFMVSALVLLISACYIAQT